MGDLELPQDLLAVLPADPYEQLDVARKITSMAISVRVTKLEGETGKLRQKIGEKENTIHNLQQQVVELEQSLQETTDRLSHALDEQGKLADEKNALAATVKKLNRDVAKLETFKRTLMQSLQEEDDASSQKYEIDKATRHSALNSFTSSAAALSLKRDSEFGSKVQALDDGSGTVTSKVTHHSRFMSMQSAADLASAATENDDEHPSDSDVRLGSQKAISLTPSQLSPTGSPRRQSAAGSPSQQSASGSPLRLSLPSSQSTSQHTTAPNSPPHVGSLPARTPRVDGKEFFRQARNRLSYEQFSAFLANIKELNAHRQTREETLRKANEIFGSENKDLYASFDGLLSRHLPA